MGISGTVYYLQINIMSLLILLGLFISNYRQYGNASAENKVFNNMIINTAIFCVADFFSWTIDGSKLHSGIIINYISNIIYISYPPIIAYIWANYVTCHIDGRTLGQRKYGFIWKVPFILFFILVASSPFTHFGFYIDEKNFYHRGAGSYIGPVLAFAHIIIVTIRTFIKAKSKKLYDRESAIMVVEFFIPIFLAAVVQLFFYGITVMQVGFTYSLLIVAFYRRRSQISQDELTGLNNRRELNKYLEKQINLNAGKIITICILDANKFKQINDKYGHIEGDTVLKLYALILSFVSRDTNWFLSRFGGDEFIMVGIDKTEEEIYRVRKEIKDEIEKRNDCLLKDYELGLSFGYAQGKITTKAEIDFIIRKADEDMYKEKNSTINL